MPHAEFVHLRVHSAYSLSRGALSVKDLVQRCRSERMPAVAVTDTGNLFGALEFSQAAAGAGIQPIVGCDIGIRRDAAPTRPGLVPSPDRVALLAQDAEGYANLLKLVSHSYMATGGHEEPQIDLEDLEAHAGGLILLTGGPAGPVGRLLLEGQTEAAEALLLRLAGAFAGRLYIEVQRHGQDAEERTEDAFVELAYRHDLPLVATNDVYFADEGMYGAHDVLLCIGQNATLAHQDRWRVTPEHRFKSAAEMQAAFADLPEAIQNTLVVAQRCAVMAESRDPILPAYPELGDKSEADKLREMAEAGLDERLRLQVYDDSMDEAARQAAAKPYRDRLVLELETIISMGFPGYFLIVADFIQWSKANGIAVGPGRGSGAGSVVAWALTITDLDPLRWGLLFERFLNPERVSMPDFDIDFCKDRRDEVIRYVQDKYGHDRVAQIITFGKLEARAALRDVGRVLGLPYGQVDRICKLVPNNPANPVKLKDAVQGEPALQRMRDEDPDVARLIGIALKLEGLYRHASTHAAGVVIADRPLDALVPLYRDPRSDMPVTQFNMKYVEKAGLVKFDFLGLKTLTVLEHAVRLIAARGIEIDLAALPLDDAATYKMMCRGDTTGVFQLESSGMRDVLRKLKPDRFEDIIAVVALYRPGPMDNIPSYIRRKHKEEQPDYMHPCLEPILKETFGIMIYQEQVMQIAQRLSGYSLGGADLLRRAMGKKIKAEMEAQRKAFIDGAVANKVQKALAGHIFEQVNKFAGYGFNKSHAAAYALVAYQTAYLKANFPVEFLAASMTLDAGNTDKLAGFRAELVRLDVPLLPPDINRSGSSFTVEPVSAAEGTRLAVRYALGAIKNVGGAAMEIVAAERRAKGPFRDLFDLAERLDSRVMNKRQFENLARAGAFDCLNPNRKQVFLAADLMVRHASATQDARDSGQTSLFGEDQSFARNPPLPDAVDWPQQERLQQEFDAVGFYLSAHPLEAYRKSCSRLGVVSWSDVASGAVREARVQLVGIVGSRRIINSARGGKMAFVQMSDESGAYEITVFSELLASDRDLLESGVPLLVKVDVQRREDEIRLTAQQIRPLEEAAAQAAAGLRIFVRDSQPLPTLSGVFREHGGAGRGRVSLVLDIEDQEIEMSLPETYRITPAVRAAIKAMPGIVEVQDL